MQPTMQRSASSGGRRRRVTGLSDPLHRATTRKSTLARFCEAALISCMGSMGSMREMDGSSCCDMGSEREEGGLGKTEVKTSRSAAALVDGVRQTDETQWF